MKAVLALAALLLAAPVLAEEAPAPPVGRPLIDLFAAPTPPPAVPSPPEAGKPLAAPPPPAWSVEVGPYPTAARAGEVADVLAVHWPGAGTTQWDDAAGTAWFTATLANLTPWQAVQAAQSLRGRGMTEVRVMPPPLEPAK
ncbi:MAG: hypothetical protein WCZ23_09355 [Rhodospirillaceae bacterium]